VRNFSFLICTIPFLSACGGSSTNDLTSANFVSLDATAAFPNTLDSISSRIDSTSTDGNGFAFRIGVLDNQLIAEAGILPTSTVQNLPSAGTADFTGVAYASTYVDAEVVNGTLQGVDNTSVSSLTLTANFETGALTGSNADISVDGNFTANDLSGTVTHDGMTASLTGLVGTDVVLGAFQGKTEDSVIAGGFDLRNF